MFNVGSIACSLFFDQRARHVFILCRHERESAKNTKRLLEQRRAISKANSMARVFAVKIDEWFGSL